MFLNEPGKKLFEGNIKIHGAVQSENHEITFQQPCCRRKWSNRTGSWIARGMQPWWKWRMHYLLVKMGTVGNSICQDCDSVRTFVNSSALIEEHWPCVLITEVNRFLNCKVKRIPIIAFSSNWRERLQSLRFAKNILNFQFTRRIHFWVRLHISERKLKERRIKF